MKSPAELASRLRKMVLAAQHHYSPSGEPLRSIVVSPEWLEDMADAANVLDTQCAPPPPLTEYQVDKILETERMRWSDRSGPPTYEFAQAFARAIERAHGITQSRDSADPSSHG